MGFFSKKEATAEALPTTTAAPAAKVEEKKGGMFCGMSLSEALIAVGILGLFVFFVLWPMITAYFFMACLWVIMWPFVNYIPACANHKYVGPGYTVLSVMVTSPVKVGKFMYDKFKGGKKPEEHKEDDVMVAAASAAAAAAATSMMAGQQKV